VSVDTPPSSVAGEKAVAEPASDIFSETPPAPVTREMAYTALRDVVGTPNGMDTARKILGTFGCARISELKEENYAAFVEACGKAVMKAAQAEEATA
jgi:hypothetical protein